MHPPNGFNTMPWPWARPAFPPAPPPPPPPQFFAPFQQSYHAYPQQTFPLPPQSHQFPPQHSVSQSTRRPPNPATTKPRTNPDTSRDLATAHDTARRLGTTLPGNTPEDIRQWVEARKRNWPSRTNVHRKLEIERLKHADVKDKKGEQTMGALAKLAEYGSSDEEKGKENGKKRRRGRKRGRGRGKGKAVEKVQQVRKRKPTLLRMLLEDEIVYERKVLLQAFRYLIKEREKQKNKVVRGAVER